MEDGTKKEGKTQRPPSPAFVLFPCSLEMMPCGGNADSVTAVGNGNGTHTEDDSCLTEARERLARLDASAGNACPAFSLLSCCGLLSRADDLVPFAEIGKDVILRFEADVERLYA